MECLWCLFGYRQQDGYCHQQNPAVFYVCHRTYDGFTDYHLYGAGILEKCEKVYLGSKAESLVLFVNGE